MNDLISLREPTVADVSWLHAALNDEHTNQALIDIPHPLSHAQIIEYWISSNPRRLNRIILYKNQPVGYVWFNVYDAQEESEFSFLIHPDYQKQGLGSQIIPHLWADLLQLLRMACPCMHHLTAHTKPMHRASIRILEACGFQHDITQEMPFGNNNMTQQLSRYTLNIM